jgi:Xaa-Pro aminopeptidase
MDNKKLSDKLSSDVRMHDYEDFQNFQESLSGMRVLYDPKTGPIQIRHNLELVAAEVVRGDDVCMLSKACKNETELNGMRQAHIRDGAALTEFMAWLSDRVHSNKVTELEVSDRLREFRARKDLFKGLSFDTISGAGPNGAIVHYRVTAKSSRTLNPDEIFLLDSGGQYLDGTTDVTRTLAFNQPTAEQKDRFTRVLKGHIAIATAIFPKGTTGAQLDAFARRPLWDIGLDYQHGTGHGVGCYLCVHEGPQRIAKGLAMDVPLRPGMILSNEPGFYKEGEYGIRIESLVIVKEYNDSFLCFETITMAPICRALIDVSLLTEAEKAWLNGYHKDVREKLSAHVKADVAANVNEWLESQTAAL